MRRVAWREEAEGGVLGPEPDRRQVEVPLVAGLGRDMGDRPRGRVEGEDVAAEPGDQPEIEGDVLPHPTAVAGPVRGDQLGRDDPAAITAADLLQAETRRWRCPVKHDTARPRRDPFRQPGPERSSRHQATGTSSPRRRSAPARSSAPRPRAPRTGRATGARDGPLEPPGSTRARHGCQSRGSRGDT